MEVKLVKYTSILFHTHVCFSRHSIERTLLNINRKWKANSIHQAYLKNILLGKPIPKTSITEESKLQKLSKWIAFRFNLSSGIRFASLLVSSAIELSLFIIKSNLFSSQSSFSCWPGDILRSNYTHRHVCCHLHWHVFPAFSCLLISLLHRVFWHTSNAFRSNQRFNTSPILFLTYLLL